MANEHINKVVYFNETLIDLTGDDVQASDVQSGKIFHLPSGATATGTCTYDADTSDATAVAAEIITGKTAYKNGSKITGTMPNRGSATGTISTVSGQYTIESGFHDGSGRVSISSAEQAKIIAGNIKQGISILGVTGSYSGEGVELQSKTVYANNNADQAITADSGYDALSTVTVKKIPEERTDNAQGGVTVLIGQISA